MIALLNLSVLGFSFVVFHGKAKRTQQGDLLGLLILNDFVELSDMCIFLSICTCNSPRDRDLGYLVGNQFKV